MSFTSKAGLASAALAVALASLPSGAADLGGRRGSIKDGYEPLPVAQSSAGPCYVRADVGYSSPNAPTVKWPVSSRTDTYNATDVNDRSTYVLIDQSYSFVGDKVSNVKIDDNWFGEAGFGCGSGSWGLRAELMFGFRGEQKITGTPRDYTVTEIVNATPTTPTPGQVDPLHTSLKTYTLMGNFYKDLGNYGGFVPYVGAGVGAAYHQLGDVYFTGNPLLVNRIKGANDLAFAWSLMAGVGYQVSDRAIIDLGYRYIDLGKAASERVDNSGNVNPRVTLNDITAHEFKVGLRYHFGSDCCAAPVSLK